MAVRVAMVLAMAGIMPMASVPAFAQQQAAPSAGVLPSEPSDFRCHALLQQRGASYAAARTGDPDARAARQQSHHHLGLLCRTDSHYPASETAPALAAASTSLASLTPEQRDALARQCADFYLNVADLMSRAAAGQ